MGKIEIMNLAEEIKINFEPEGYDEESMTYGFDLCIDRMGKKLFDRADLYRAEAKKIECSINDGRIPDWKINLMIDKVKRLKIEANTFDALGTEMEHYSNNMTSPQTMVTLGGSVTLI